MTQQCVEEGLHIVYACRPCDLCKYTETRPRVCLACSVLFPQSQWETAQRMGQVMAAEAANLTDADASRCE